MFSNLVSLINQTLSSTFYTPKVEKSNNPFASADGNNPYVSLSFASSQNPNYGKNQPVPGGYFAGYYNGVPNIVGRRLFIEV